MGIPIIGKLVDGAMSLISEAIPDKDKRDEIRARMMELFTNYEAELVRQAGETIRAEATSESWLARSWRPITMLTFVALIVAQWLGFTAPGITEEMQLELLSLIKIGLGGYVAGRSAEKIAGTIAPAIRSWKEKKDS